jgi:hypothetical protein
MPASVLGHLLLGYQLVWDRNRRPRGVHLRVEATEGEAVDAALLLRMLADSWSGTAPQLILSTPEEWLLRAFLQHADAQSPWIAVHQAQLALPDMAPLVHAAHARGAQLLWRGESGAQTPLDTAGAFGLGMLTLTAGEALWSLRATRARGNRAAAVLAARRAPWSRARSTKPCPAWPWRAIAWMNRTRGASQAGRWTTCSCAVTSNRRCPTAPACGH